MALTRTPDPIRPTTRGLDPNQPTYASKEGVMTSVRFVRKAAGFFRRGYCSWETSPLPTSYLRGLGSARSFWGIFTVRCDASAVLQCLSVRLSVRPARSWITSKRINISSKFFTTAGSDTIQVFPYQRGCRYSDGNPPNGGVECKGYDKITIFFINISLYLRNGYS